MNILVTALDPSGREKISPALEAIRQLGPTIGAHTITTLEILAVFHRSKDVTQHELRHHHYGVVLSIGQAGGRFDITPERTGINIDCAHIADNKENQPIDVTIHPNDAPAYSSNLPVKPMAEAIKEVGVPAGLSNTAGTSVCNHVPYQLGYLTDKFYPSLSFGFIRVPFVPKQIVDRPSIPSLPLDAITKGITTAVNTISDLPDVKVASGETRQKIR